MDLDLEVAVELQPKSNPNPTSVDPTSWNINALAAKSRA
jgi:hypothetical protein